MDQTVNTSHRNTILWAKPTENPSLVKIEEKKDQCRVGEITFSLIKRYRQVRKKNREKRRTRFRTISRSISDVFKKILDYFVVLKNKESQFFKSLGSFEDKVKMVIPVFVISDIVTFFNSAANIFFARKRADREGVHDHLHKNVVASSRVAMNALGFVTFSNRLNKMSAIASKAHTLSRAIPILGLVISGLNSIYESFEAWRIVKNARKFKAIFNNFLKSHPEKLIEALEGLDQRLKLYRESEEFQKNVMDPLNKKYKEDLSEQKLIENEKIIDRLNQTEIELIEKHLKDHNKLFLDSKFLPEELTQTTIDALLDLKNRNPGVRLIKILKQVEEYKTLTRPFRKAAKNYLTKRVGSALAKEILSTNLKELILQVKAENADAVNKAEKLMEGYQKGLRKQMKLKIIGIVGSIFAFIGSAAALTNPITASVLIGISVGFMIYKFYAQKKEKIESFNNSRIFGFKFADFQISQKKILPLDFKQAI